MAYDANFWRLYEAYLHEPTVRANHDRMIRRFHHLVLNSELPGPKRRPGELMTLDLGCGLREFVRSKKAWCPAYHGVDVADATEAVPAARKEIDTLYKWTFEAGDYRDPSLLERLPFPPNSFVSLFSIEAFLPAAERYALYHRLFERLPAMHWGMSAGFYYAHKRGEETVQENGDIVSYQTIDDLYDHVDPLFDEERILVRTPSAMFGPDVVEVWKFFVRKTP